MVNANDIANYFIFKSCPGTNENITNLKLQKLLYYAQGEYSRTQDSPLFRDRIEAWKHGPVVPNIYRKYSKYAFNEIIRDVNEESIGEIQQKELNEFLDCVWRKYGGFNGKQLERMTHLEDPWENAREGLPYYVSSTKKIKWNNIKSYFRKNGGA